MYDYWSIAWRFFVIASFAFGIAFVAFAVGQRGTYQKGFENGAKVGYAQGRQHCAAPQRYRTLDNSFMDTGYTGTEWGSDSAH
jgi:hypothetical protein